MNLAEQVRLAGVVGAGGGVVSVTAVSFTYWAHDLAMASFGSHTERLSAPENFAAGTGETIAPSFR